ncbi:MAG: hypothetical protein H8E66_05580 [Planctomycetes bacterium]|nr:hypothetical protein [Planctomycetota bacterium]
MLVIVSDLHLNDKTTGSPLNSGAFQIFAERLHETAVRASWRADGTYRPIERLDLVLLGDVLDLTGTAHWATHDVRPWSEPNTPLVSDAVASIVDNILTRNQESCEVLRAISTDGAIRIPPAMESGLPAYDTEGVPVAVRTSYMVGNHDWLLHLPGTRYDTIRQKVTHHLGLSNIYNAPFPHDPYESDELLATMRRHRVFARHGDIFDPLNFSEDRDNASLGDAIVIELITRFAIAIEQHFANDLPQSVINGLRELDHIRPILLAPVWIEGLLERSNVRPAVRKEIKRTWDRLADEFLHLSLVQDQDSWSAFDIVDGLERALKFSKRLSLGWAGKVTSWLHSLRGSESGSYYQHALAEQDFRNRRARNIVYGHTHHAEAIPLDASYADGYVLNQMYFNSGTWRRVLDQTRCTSSEHEFIPTESLSILSFFHGDERGGRPFETWTGMLATVNDSATHRVDSGRTPHASEQPLSSPRVPVKAPHFRSTSAPSRSSTREIY